MNNSREQNENNYENEIGYPLFSSTKCKSNSEFVILQCPACGQVLREEEYYDACEEIRIVANEIAKRTVQEHIRELESEFLKIQRGKRT